MKSVMRHSFSNVPTVDVPRSTFDRSHGLKTTFDGGYLVPIFCDEVVPGDSFNINMYGFIRMSTPVFPVMDNMYLDTHFFFVPNRMVWNNFKKMMGEQDNPADSIDYSVPVVDVTAAPVSTTGYVELSLQDMFGIPPGVVGLEHSQLPLRCYNLVWNEWFRDQNLQDSVTVDKDDGPDDPADYVLLKRGKRHDYFTSCLPHLQKGDSVSIPLGSEANVLGIGTNSGAWNKTSATVRETGASGSTTYTNATAASGTDQVLIEQDASTGYPNIRADLTNATAATINQLRQAFQVQRLLERDARSGTRYHELVKAHFGVESLDRRATRPEYLGGGSSPINVTPVYNLATTQYPHVASSQKGLLGEPGAYATASIDGHGFTKSFTEHGYIIGLASVRADLTYQQGLERFWSRSTRYDFYWPALSTLGEMSVLNKEIYAQGTAGGTDDDTVFGYQEAYGDMRYKPSRIAGAFRSSYSQSLDAWHLSQEFGSLPGLNATFIEEDPPIDRVIAATLEPHFVMDAYFSMRCARPMPLHGVPGLIDHF